MIIEWRAPTRLKDIKVSGCLIMGHSVYMKVVVEGVERYLDLEEGRVFMISDEQCIPINAKLVIDLSPESGGKDVQEKEGS